MAEDVGEKTEAATPRRREQARSRGQSANSRDLASAVILLAGLIGAQIYGSGLLEAFARILRYCLQSPWLDLSVERVRIELSRLAIISVEALWAFMVIVYLATLVISYYQTGGVRLASEKNYFDPARLNPISGLQRIFSRRGLVKTVFDVGKVIAVGSVAYLFLLERLPALANLSRLPFPTIGGYAFSESLLFAYYLLAILLVLGLADYLYQRYQFEEDLKMTKQQVKEEARDMEGSPDVKSRRRQIQLQLARQRMMKEVPEAEVVITNPTELAVALKYKVGEMDAPVVAAMGAGVFARRIREIALEHGIPIIENRPLAQLLFHNAEVGRVIPEATFVAVAEIMAYVYQLTNRAVPPRPQ